MSREWKPGDVAMVTWTRRSDPLDLVGIMADDGDWVTIVGRIDGDADARPLVVIDPEDRAQVERLAAALVAEKRCGDSGLHVCGKSECVGHRLQDALRSLIAPPKPEEPTGLGAVVEDATGEAWIRAARIKHGWHRPMGTWATYDDIDAVKVLSEGVTP